MASEENDTVLTQSLDDDDSSSSQTQDDDEDIENDDVLPAEEEEEEFEEEDLASISPPLAVPSSSAVTIAVPNGISDPPSTSVVAPSHLPKPNRLALSKTTTALVVSAKPQQTDKSRQLFQRLWTDEDEIELLQGFLDYTSQRGSNYHDTTQFYDQIKSKFQLDFNKNQLVEKLRRLKKKYRNVIEKINSGKDFNFKTAHDQATFEISRKIWSSTGKILENFEDDDAHPNLGNPNFNINLNEVEGAKSTQPKSRKRPRSRMTTVVVDDRHDRRDGFVGNYDVNNSNVGNVGNVSNVGNFSNVDVSSLVEETVKKSLSPLFKELSNGMRYGGFCGGRGIAGLALNVLPLSFGGGDMMMDERWRKQQILELEVYSKRLELVQEQIRAQLDELRSMGR